MRKRKSSLILGIILLLGVLGIGYAYLNTTLNISGVTDIDSNTWSVYWNNVQVTTGSVTGDQVTEEPTIDTNKTTVSFHVRLSQPGDYYEFTVDAVNNGSIDAMIDTISKTINDGTTIPDYLTYTVTYSDGRDLSNQYLKSNTTETLKVRVEYRNDINANELPTNPASLNLSFSVNYVQANNNALPRLLYYSYNSSAPQETINQLVNTYIIIEQGESGVLQTSLYYKKENVTFIAGIAEHDNNLSKLREICDYTYSDSIQWYECVTNNGSDNIRIHDSGRVSIWIQHGNEGCNINDDLNYSCFSVPVAP